MNVKVQPESETGQCQNSTHIVAKYGISPIETTYAGYRFRSRLEARHAVMLDRLGVRWEYETQGFNLDGMRYLPDFRVFGTANGPAFIEIKPEGDAQPWELEKSHRLAMAAQCMVYTFRGSFEVRDQDPCCIVPANSTVPIADADFPSGDWDSGYIWCQCPQCGGFGIEFQGRADRLQCACVKDGDRGHNAWTDRLIWAYLGAQQARFEHGEQG